MSEKKEMKEIQEGDTGSFVTAQGVIRACVVCGFTKDNCLKVRYSVRSLSYVVYIGREEFTPDENEN